MTDYSELKRLAEVLNRAIAQAEHKPGEWAETVQSMGGICCPGEPFQIGKPWAKEEPWASFSYKRDSWLAVAAVNALPELLGLIAENEALRKQIPSAEIVWCACGDGHAANSYGAGFMDANGGACANCDAASASVESDLDALRRDAERYRRARDIACRVRASVGFHLVVQLPSPSGSSLCTAKAFDEAIDAVMSKGDQA